MFERDPDNPLITGDLLCWPANSVFNPGAVQLPDGTVLLLVRVEDRRGLSSLHVARSADGRTGWEIEPTPLLAPERHETTGQWGYEDARVVWLPEIERFVITCTAFGAPGPCVFLATTTDFRSIERSGVALPPEDKNAALFPRRFGGCWLLLHRPVVMASGSADVWVSVSDDLWSWRQAQPVMVRRPGGWWDAARIGIGPPPIETELGWLLLYHGVRQTVSGAIYRVGAALLALDDPTRVTHRLDEWVLAPTAPYERVGDVGNVVFPCGAIVHDEGTADATLALYYGAADTTVCRATARIDDLLGALQATPD